MQYHGEPQQNIFHFSTLRIPPMGCLWNPLIQSQVNNCSVLCLSCNYPPSQATFCTFGFRSVHLIFHIHTHSNSVSVLVHIVLKFLLYFYYYYYYYYQKVHDELLLLLLANRECYTIKFYMASCTCPMCKTISKFMVPLNISLTYLP